MEEEEAQHQNGAEMAEKQPEQEQQVWDDDAFVERCRIVALERGWTLHALCGRAGVARDYLGKTPSTGRNLASIYKIANTLGVPMSWLLGFDDEIDRAARIAGIVAKTTFSQIYKSPITEADIKIVTAAVNTELLVSVKNIQMNEKEKERQTYQYWPGVVWTPSYEASASGMLPQEIFGNSMQVYETKPPLPPLELQKKRRKRTRVRKNTQTTVPR